MDSEKELLDSPGKSRRVWRKAFTFICLHSYTYSNE